MSLTDSEKNKLKRYKLSGLNKPKRTPQHPTKKAVVAVRDKGRIKIIRFGDQKMGRTLPREKQVELFGPIKFFGLDPVVLKKDHLNLKSMFVV